MNAADFPIGSRFKGAITVAYAETKDGPAKREGEFVIQDWSPAHSWVRLWSAPQMDSGWYLAARIEVTEKIAP